MQSCDILIVGGGPAGSSIAWGLRNSGLTVVIIDKQPFPRNKTCAGWITPGITDTLQLDLEQYAHDRTLQSIYGFRVGQIGGDAIETDYGSKPVSYGIRRCEFDHYLLQRCGATFLPGESFRDIRRKDNYWIVNDSIKSRLVIGAGGHFCPVARHLGARIGQSELSVVAQESEFRITEKQGKLCAIRPEIPELFFCPDLKGYGWVFRKGDYINIGLGREDHHGIAKHVRDFCDFLHETGKIPPGLPLSFSGHSYLLYQHSTRPALTEGIMLVGDAAGLAYTRSGEGIRPAIESGLIASSVIIEADDNYSIDNLARYGESITRRFGKKTAGFRLFPGISANLRQLLARQLFKSRWFIQHAIVNRCFLHSNQPSLISI